MGDISNYFENCSGGNLKNNYKHISLDESVLNFFVHDCEYAGEESTVVFRAARCS
jgi:hypothetical protein